MSCSPDEGPCPPACHLWARICPSSEACLQFPQWRPGLCRTLSWGSSFPGRLWGHAGWREAAVGGLGPARGGGGSPRWILACWGRWVEGAGSRQSQLLGWPRATSQCLQSVHWRQTQRPWGTDAQGAAFVKRRAGQALAGAEELEDGKQGSAPPGPSPPPVCAWDPARSGFAHVQTSKPARPQCRGTEMQPQVPSEEER